MIRPSKKNPVHEIEVQPKNPAWANPILSAGKGGAKRPRVYSKASPPGIRLKDKMKNAPSRSTPEEDGGRKTTADVLEGFAPPLPPFREFR